MQARGSFGTGVLQLVDEAADSLPHAALELLVAALVHLQSDCRRSKAFPDPLLVARTLGEISNALSHNTPLEELLQRLVRSARSLLRMDRVSIFLYDHRRGTFSAHVSWGTGGPATQLAKELTGEEREIVERRLPVVVQDAARSSTNPYFARLGVRSSLDVPMIAGDQIVGILCCHTIKRPRRFSADDLVLATTFANEAAVAILNNQLYERTLASHGRMFALYQASRAMGVSLEIERVGRAILRSARQSAAIPAAALVLPAPSRPALQTSARQDGFVAWRAACSSALVAHIHAARPDAPAPIPSWHAGALVGCSLPLELNEGAMGWLELYAEDATTLADATPTLLALGQHASSTLKNARLYESLEKTRGQLRELVEQLVTAREEEARRVAYDVHDSLGQVLVGADQHLQAAQFALGQGAQPRAGEELQLGRGLVASGIREARAIVNRLRPPGLDEFGLETSLRSYCADFSRHTGATVNLDLDLPAERLPETHEVVLFRIAQEALANATRHGRAHTVWVSTKADRQAVTLVVDDDGVGMSAAMEQATPGQSGVGVLGMRERARLLGGSVELKDRSEGGVQLVAYLPLIPLGSALHA